MSTWFGLSGGVLYDANGVWFSVPAGQTVQVPRPSSQIVNGQGLIAAGAVALVSG
jgi:hypothetical protein